MRTASSRRLRAPSRRAGDPAGGDAEREAPEPHHPRTSTVPGSTLTHARKLKLLNQSTEPLGSLRLPQRSARLTL